MLSQKCTTNLFPHKACLVCHLSLRHQPSALPQAEQSEASTLSPSLATLVPSPGQKHCRLASHLLLSESDTRSRAHEGDVLAENKMLKILMLVKSNKLLIHFLRCLQWSNCRYSLGWKASVRYWQVKNCSSAGLVTKLFNWDMVAVSSNYCLVFIIEQCRENSHGSLVKLSICFHVISNLYRVIMVIYTSDFSDA